MSDLRSYQIRALGPGDLGLMREMLECFGEVFGELSTHINLIHP